MLDIFLGLTSLYCLHYKTSQETLPTYTIAHDSTKIIFCDYCDHYCEDISRTVQKLSYHNQTLVKEKLDLQNRLLILKDRLHLLFIQNQELKTQNAELQLIAFQDISDTLAHCNQPTSSTQFLSTGRADEKREEM